MPAAPATDGPHVILDVSRLLGCGRKRTPSGIDRVELAYARHYLTAPPEQCSFAGQELHGGFGLLPRKLVAELVENLTEAWSSGLANGPAFRRAARLGALGRGRLLLGLGRGDLSRLLQRGRRLAYLLVSHQALDRAAPIEALRRTGCAFVPLIHDLIPVTHPEYARPGQAEKHLRRIGTTAALADGIIVNSAATADALAPHLGGRAAPPPVLVAPLGIDTLPRQAPSGEDPYFVTLGTIEPRKNHLLLLHLWRQMALTHGAATPRLLIIGKRGWENENIVDILERCTALHGVVQEVGQLPDRSVAELLQGARALLFPSFAEGYGLPLAEALAAGVPAICSDLPALREVGGEVPDYLDPLDGAAWREAVLDYASPGSPARSAQMARLEGWQAPAWADHFQLVDGLLRQVTDPARQRGLAQPAPRPAARPAPAPAAARPRPAAEPGWAGQQGVATGGVVAARAQAVP
ncbi:glycosyltransferase family 1 protein [Pseudoroseomonas cervicalis]|uniref:glycosyltransferase family 4 protein n=1 Tax=Teichococcus cervicalis TaxID=204525 RepID=UPI0022F17526|nr:glycosyltransferase family 1 protein [Pseudoroseomonas cervicalis]WBV43095.1 glycosyltransferase family 1 protein [Pseudoroseomonas cervicalis]